MEANQAIQDSQDATSEQVRGSSPARPIMVLRRAEERGRGSHGWLDSRHTFSFAGYHDPRFMGFRALRVINEDRVVGGAGFGTHPHRDMEIISYVIDGALEHRDSMGNGSVIRPGEVQRMSAGRGVRHSEKNASSTEGVHFLQIWVLPNRRGVEPSYEQRFFGDERRGRLRLVVSEDGRDGSLRLHQDVSLYAAVLTAGERVTHSPAPGKHLWIQMVRGSARVAGETLRAGDGAALPNERGDAALDALEIEADGDCELLLFELA